MINDEMVIVSAADLRTVLNQHTAHAHSRPGIWDSDNRPGLANTRCMDCDARDRLIVRSVVREWRRLRTMSSVEMFCRQCKTALATISLDGKKVVGYQHQSSLRGTPEDHKPDPIPLAELPDAIIICDFCDNPKTVWTYVCADQATQTVRVTEKVVGQADYQDRHGAARVRRLETENDRLMRWGEKWSACAECAALIDERDLFGLVRRVCDHLPSKLTNARALPKTRASLFTFYGNIFATLGERIPIVRGT